MKNSIVERLLSQGHISIRIADAILNNKKTSVEHISDLKHDGVITNSEAVTLLIDGKIQTISFSTPNQTSPQYQYGYTYCPNQIGVPSWNVTCTGCTTGCVRCTN